uniref:Uncharacterized protein n=1 Tax=Marseillevirus LCMAC101 TaxID=2506602 RepID=A0A481YTV0_9VIRU|nr:MAG: hypothetical protein LCMAC101_05210 [Marseillevirus LCMAC101]
MDISVKTELFNFLPYIEWEDEERRNANEFLHFAVEQYKNFLDPQIKSNDFQSVIDEIEITLSSLIDNVIYPEHVRNRGRINIFAQPPGSLGGPIGCALAIHAGPRRGRCQNRLYRGVRLYCNKEIHKKGRCRYHLRKFRQKHYL